MLLQKFQTKVCFLSAFMYQRNYWVQSKERGSFFFFFNSNKKQGKHIFVYKESLLVLRINVTRNP